MKTLLAEFSSLKTGTNKPSSQNSATSNSSSQNSKASCSKNKKGKQQNSNKQEDMKADESAANDSQSEPTTSSSQSSNANNNSLIVETQEVNGSECELIILIDPGLIKQVQDTVLAVCKGQGHCEVISLKETVEGDELIS